MSGITAPATINLALLFASSSQTGLDALVSVENVIGGSGNDTITGSAVANRLDGQGGNDTITAGAGNDVVIGGAGNDTMDGGSGNDAFIFAPGFGNDRVLGFDANPSGGQDFLDISAFGITKTTFATRVKIADVGADTLVTIDGNVAQTIRLIGIGDATTVTQADFIL
jgi:Ca2+-binding RTX toxin-like protein